MSESVCGVRVCVTNAHRATCIHKPSFLQTPGAQAAASVATSRQRRTRSLDGDTMQPGPQDVRDSWTRTRPSFPPPHKWPPPACFPSPDAPHFLRETQCRSPAPGSAAGSPETATGQRLRGAGRGVGHPAVPRKAGADSEHGSTHAAPPSPPAVRRRISSDLPGGRM